MDTHLLATILRLLAVDYGCVLAAVIVDLATRLASLRRRDTPCTSRGLRRSVTKLSGYYAALFSLTVVDAVTVAATLCLEACGETPPLAPFPYLTTLGAASLCLIEMKSVSENTGVPIDLGAIINLLRSRFHNIIH